MEFLLKEGALAHASPFFCIESFLPYTRRLGKCVLVGSWWRADVGGGSGERG